MRTVNKVAEWLADLQENGSYQDMPDPWHLADQLNQYGFLAPDQPEPLTAANGNPVWRADDTLMVTRYPDGEIAMLLNPKQEARYTPQAARDQAALLLAAANYSEGNRE